MPTPGDPALLSLRREAVNLHFLPAAETVPFSLQDQGGRPQGGQVLDAQLYRIPGPASASIAGQCRTGQHHHAPPIPQLTPDCPDSAESPHQTTDVNPFPSQSKELKGGGTSLIRLQLAMGGAIHPRRRQVCGQEP